MVPFSARTPWILVGRHPQGGFVVRDTRSGAEVYAASEHAVAQAAAGMSSAPGYHGLGDVVAGAARRLGFESCTPCARRQAELNARVPRLFRR